MDCDVTVDYERCSEERLILGVSFAVVAGPLLGVHLLASLRLDIHLQELHVDASFHVRQVWLHSCQNNRLTIIVLDRRAFHPFFVTTVNFFQPSRWVPVCGRRRRRRRTSRYDFSTRQLILNQH